MAGLYLSTHKAGHAIGEAQLHAHLEALVEGIYVTQITPRYDDPIWHLPVKLLADLDGRRLLALQPQAVHGVGQIDG